MSEVDHDAAKECPTCAGAKYIVVGVQGFDEVGRERPPFAFLAYACADINEASEKARSVNGAIYAFRDGELTLLDWNN